MYDSMPWFSLIKLADDPEYGDLYTVLFKNHLFTL